MAHIIVIDDDKDILRLIEFTLKRAGHTVSVCVDGVQGLAQTEDQRPDLVVCDVMMPKMTGYEFCKRARANPQLKHTPIIIFSARFQPIDRQTALDAGATDYLPKSTAPDALVKRISELVQPAAKTPARKMIGLFSLRGGAGVTSLAVNLALALALTQKTKVSLVDLALLGGHAALMLGVRPTSNVPKLLTSVTGNFTPEAMQPHFIQHNSGVQLLASPPTLNQHMTLTDDRLLNLANGLKSISAITVLDVPHMLEEQFSPVLQLLDKIVLVLSPDMPAVQSTVIALQGLVQLGVENNKIVMIVNQVSPHNPLPIDTIQNVTRRPIFASIPFEPDMTKAVNTGKPLLLLSPKSAGAVAIGRLAVSLAAS
jgi:pilus assembly protein CpaE